MNSNCWQNALTSRAMKSAQARAIKHVAAHVGGNVFALLIADSTDPAPELSPKIAARDAVRRAVIRKICAVRRHMALTFKLKRKELTQRNSNTPQIDLIHPIAHLLQAALTRGLSKQISTPLKRQRQTVATPLHVIFNTLNRCKRIFRQVGTQCAVNILRYLTSCLHHPRLNGPVDNAATKPLSRIYSPRSHRERRFRAFTKLWGRCVELSPTARPSH